MKAYGLITWIFFRPRTSQKVVWSNPSWLYFNRGQNALGSNVFWLVKLLLRILENACVKSRHRCGNDNLIHDIYLCVACSESCDLVDCKDGSRSKGRGFKSRHRYTRWKWCQCHIGLINTPSLVLQMIVEPIVCWESKKNSSYFQICGSLNLGCYICNEFENAPYCSRSMWKQHVATRL